MTDYYDGSLDDFQKEVLMDFLDRNPDLKSEFEDYPGLSIIPGDEEPFAHSGLLRSADQLSNEQIEHFAIALSENDLNAEQRKEILELRKSDPRFREYINIYEKIKLKPGDIKYPDKKNLLKIPENRKKIKLVLLSVSTAASIAIIAGLFMLFSQESGDRLNRQLTADSGQENRRLQESFQDMPQKLPAKTIINIADPDRAGQIINTRTLAEAGIAGEVTKAQITAEPVRTGKTIDTRTTVEPAKEIITITPVAAKENIRLDIAQTHFLLAETSTYPAYPETGPSDMSVREYLAYQFRKQILADEDPDTENLKAWEIADAGVRGFNKVLGWDMELKAEQDPEGNVNDISFTSQLIKFDHKAKKSNGDL
ncbi:MAG: hypothetical protein U5K32_03740 [Bacteroidales bacterium]|nr:hypothetical protein [Bacteroidales bacterium]